MKKYAGPTLSHRREDEQFSERKIHQEYMSRLSQAAGDEDYDDGSPWDRVAHTERPGRARRRNPRYYNEDFVNEVRMEDRQ